MSNSIAPGSSADVNVKVTALTTNPNVPVTYKTIILKKNLVNGVNTLTQEMMSAQNTKYVIKYDYVLGEDITVPENCILEFDGGSLNNGNIVSNNDCVIRNAKFEDVAISFSDANLKVYDSIFFYNSESNIENGISLTNASIVIEGCSFNGTVSYAYVNNEGSGFAENKIIYNIINCNFTGNCQFAIRLYGTTAVESSVSSALLKDDYIILESGNPYFLANLKNAQVYGGEYTSKTSSAASNLYSCDSAEIIGGYYHDLNRGATIGGRVGKYSIITNTINKNISYAGVDIDWATTSEAPYTYSDGYGIISNNICENCTYCCYVQGRNVKITDNIFKWGENSSNTAVRLNNLSGESDNNLIVKNNYFDFEGKAVYPVTLGNNTTCYFGDNIIKSNVINYVNLSTGSKVFELNTLYVNSSNEVANYYLYKEYEKVVIDSSVSTINTFRLQTDSPKVKSTLIVNNSSRNIQLIPHSGSSLVIYGNMYLYANSSYVVTYIDNLTAIVSAVIESGVIKNNNTRPTVLSVGSSYFDTTLGKPIYWNGTAWVDATGTAV